MSESKTRSVAAIGNSRVIPAKAGIQAAFCAGKIGPRPAPGRQFIV